jgi:hypothetical protein
LEIGGWNERPRGGGKLEVRLDAGRRRLRKLEVEKRGREVVETGGQA